MRLRNLIIIIILFTMWHSSIEAQWEQIGWPGGQIRILTKLNSTLFGCCGNLFYKSTDFGSTWTPFNKGLPVVNYAYSSLYSVYLFPMNNRVYIYFNSYYQPNFLNGQVFSCSESDTVWSEEDYPLINGQYPSVGHLYSLSKDSIFTLIHPTDSTYEFYLSTNKGNTWEERPNSLPNASCANILHFANTFYFIPCTAYTNPQESNIFASSDFGGTWSNILTLSDTVNGSLNLLEDSLWVITADYLQRPLVYRSTDLGKTWLNCYFQLIDSESIQRILSTSVQYIGTKMFAKLDIVYDNGHKSNTQIFRSDDKGYSWRLLRNDSADTFNFVVQERDNYIVYFYNKGYFETDSNLKEFKPLPAASGLFSNGNLLFVSDNILIATPLDPIGFQDSLFDSILVSTDDGSHWIKDQFSTSYLVNGLLRWHQSNGKIYTTGVEKKTQKKCVLISDDNGATWSSKLLPQTSGYTTKLLALHDTLIVTANAILVGDSVRLFISVDGGQSWKSLYTQPQFGATKSDFDYYRGWLIFTDHASSDMGNSWIEAGMISLFQDFKPPLGGLLFPNGHIGDYWYYMGTINQYSTQTSLNYSVDLGISWKKCTGLPTDCYIYPNLFENGIMYASAYDDTWLGNDYRLPIYYSLDTGKFWQQTPGYLTEATELFSNSQYFFAAGQNELWRLPKSLAGVPKTTSPITPTISIASFYPNPTSTEMKIEYSVPNHGVVSLKAFDITGRERDNIITETEEPGSHTVQWNTSSLPTGTYILRLTNGSESVSKVVQIIR